jgi:hypothetical protein
VDLGLKRPKHEAPIPRSLKVGLAIVVLISLAILARWRGETSRGQFDFDNYDKIPLHERSAAALKDLYGQFPVGSSVDAFVSYLERKQNGRCEERKWIPETDKYAFKDNNIYCGVNYIFSRWVINIQYGDDRKIEEIKLSLQQQDWP